jgi:phospholipid/cholesterol/gamma-HCH transport system substrate-binding protein
MNGENKNIRLGVFVSTGTLLLIFAFYLIGKKQNLFGNTFTVSAKFYNVNGLMVGNNVRLSGIDVGTVKEIEVVSDTAVKVVMNIERDMQKYIKKSALASIGTDGLMGNKLVNINSTDANSLNVAEGDELKTLSPVEMDDMIRTLSFSNENMRVITANLRAVTDKFNSDNSMWNLLTDTVLAKNVRSAIVNFKVTGGNTAIVTGELQSIVKDIKAGKGMAGVLLTDTAASGRLKQTLVNIKAISDSVVIISGNFKSLSSDLKNGRGSIGALLTDTSFIHNLNQSLLIIKKGAGGFTENMEAVKYSWPFKKYYKRKK